MMPNAYIELIKDNIQDPIYHMKDDDWQNKALYEGKVVICEVVCVKRNTNLYCRKIILMSL